MSWATPVEVSLACTYTALIPGSFLRASATTLGSTARPHSTLISVTSAPKVLQSLVHRSPNFPPLIVRALSPGERKLETAPSMPPVPDAARISTLFFVWYNTLSPSRTSERAYRTREHGDGSWAEPWPAVLQGAQASDR